MSERKQLTAEERELFIRTHYRALEAYMRFGLMSLPKKRIPKLVIAMDNGSYTDNEVIHIGISEIDASTDQELLYWVKYLIGHESQHILSTTDKAWKYGMKKGYETILQEMSRNLESRPRRFRKESDYDRFLEDMKKMGYNLNKSRIRNFVHFVQNSLEDGRIERIRCILRPRFKEYLKRCRGQVYLTSPVDEEWKDKLDEPYVYLSIILNQILTLSTTSLYQMNFVDICMKDTKIYHTVQNLIPFIKNAVSGEDCRNCMENGIQICSILAMEIAEASKKSDFEEFLEELFKMLSDDSFSATSRSEEKADSSISFDLFGISDMEEDGDASSASSEAGDKDSEKSSDDGDGEGKASDADDAGKEDADGSPKGDGKGTPSEKSSGKPSSSSAKSSSDGVSKSDIASKIKDSISSAEKELYDEMKATMESSYVHKPKKPESLVEKTGDETKVDLDSVAEDYDYKVDFKEEERTYVPDEKLPVDLMHRSNVLKTKIEKVFKDMRKPELRSMRSGIIDGGFLYKIAMNDINIFKREQQTNEFDGCCYMLVDNSGSMGCGSYSKRAKCSRAVAVMEYAFQNIMPVKISAFDAFGSESVRHKLIKNWNEKVANNATWNFYVKDRVGCGNKDGYSIRVATKEILARPEKNKLLIVLSDGVPTDYPGGIPAGIKDVHSAVIEARKSGVNVVAIYFGDDISDSNPDIPVFKNMYEKNYIVSEPDFIAEPLLRVLKRFVF